MKEQHQPLLDRLSQLEQMNVKTGSLVFSYPHRGSVDVYEGEHCHHVHLGREEIEEDVEALTIEYTHPTEEGSTTVKVSLVPRVWKSGVPLHLTECYLVILTETVDDDRFRTLSERKVYLRDEETVQRVQRLYGKLTGFEADPEREAFFKLDYIVNTLRLSDPLHWDSANDHRVRYEEDLMRGGGKLDIEYLYGDSLVEISLTDRERDVQSGNLMVSFEEDGDHYTWSYWYRGLNQWQFEVKGQLPHWLDSEKLKYLMESIYVLAGKATTADLFRKRVGK